MRMRTVRACRSRGMLGTLAAMDLLIDVETLGTLIVTIDDDGVISRITFSDEPIGGAGTNGRRPEPPMSDVEREIHRYLAGELMAMRLRYRAHGTPFQQAVWEQLTRIPYGTTATYGQIAARVGRPGAARAVGNACGANPVPLLIPCHRAVAANGGLGGFTSGVWRKRLLIAMEGEL